MALVTHNKASDYKQLLEGLFTRANHVLVEVRFPGMAVGPDWYLIEEEEELKPILDRLGPGTQVFLHNVLDLKNSKDPICVQK